MAVRCIAMCVYSFPPEMLELGRTTNQRHRHGKPEGEKRTEPLWLTEDSNNNNNNNLRNERIFGENQMKIQPASMGLHYSSLVSFLFGLFVCFGLYQSIDPKAFRIF